MSSKFSPADHERASSWWPTLIAIAALVVWRALIGIQPHSGQDNHHGSKTAYGGDYEAQRHWMELTYHLPMAQWYWYDLDYWGLDYPPLTAYISWLCAAAADFIPGLQDSVALETSRGYEDVLLHKPFMRGTVLFWEWIIFATAVGAWSQRLAQPGKSLALFVFVMAQPSILLIDHGHFQYNTTALGLALWGFWGMTRSTQTRDVVFGSICFCLALSFKQMTLYYAPVVGCYLLGRCFAHQPLFVRNFVVLAVTVVLTFGLVWGPIIFSSSDDVIRTPQEQLGQILHRIFPVQRGLFEGKVSNLWCALSVKPFRIRQRLDEVWQFRAALLGTVILMSQSCAAAAWSGSQFPFGTKSKLDSRLQALQQRQQSWALLCTACSCSLAFFLCSFQVHEKSLLLVVAPLSLFWATTPTNLFAEWFSLLSAWTMWPLLVVDRLCTAYTCTLLIFVSGLVVYRDFVGVTVSDSPWYVVAASRLSYLSLGALHMAELVWNPPAHWPDLFPLLWSVMGCGHLCIAYLFMGWIMYRCTTSTALSMSSAHEKSE